MNYGVGRLMVVLCIVGSVMAENKVQTVEYQPVSAKKAGALTLELAKMHFYFDESPAITKRPLEKVSPHQERLTFVFAATTLVHPEQLEKIVQSIKAATNLFYQVHYTSASTGVTLAFSYNPEKVSIHTQVRDIGHEKKRGNHEFVVTLYNKELLKSLHEKKANVLQTAWSAYGSWYVVV